MSVKRPPSPDLIANPFIKKRNLDWTLDLPGQGTNNSSNTSPSLSAETTETKQTNITTADVEAGRVPVPDHLSLFTERLSSHIITASIPKLLPISSYADLYRANIGSAEGAHFVIHQHDHPIAGTHYDLRLQINPSSSVSWAIMYGLPGDPNSVRLNRNATETRIHCLWNHLIETASSATGSLLIWDTGTYSILPRQSKHDPPADPSSPTASPHSSPSPPPSQQSLLHNAFQQRKIRVRLHGTRLPDPYIVNLRLTKKEDAAGRSKTTGPRRRRRRRQPKTPEETSDEDDSEPDLAPSSTIPEPAAADISPMEREIRELEDDEVRRTNAYPGASNTIGSIYQRRWYLSLDRPGCGFIQGKNKIWRKEPSQGRGYPFYVRGADHEHSIVTGRRGADILHDEGVTDFVRRKGWNPVIN